MNLTSNTLRVEYMFVLPNSRVFGYKAGQTGSLNSNYLHRFDSPHEMEHHPDIVPNTSDEHSESEKVAIFADNISPADQYVVMRAH